MAKPETIQEIHRKILAAINNGSSVNDGSYTSVLAGAVATQIYTLNQNNWIAKLQQDPTFSDAHSLVLKGRSIGTFLLAASPAEIEIRTERALNDGETLTVVDTKQQFTVFYAEPGNNRYYLRSAVAGAAKNTIQQDWYTEVTFTAASAPDEPFTASVVQVLMPGRDEEPVDEFRARVSGGLMTRPFNANAQFFKLDLTQTLSGIDCVRIQIDKYLSGQNRSVVKFYLGDSDLMPVTEYVRERAKKRLDETKPIGMEYEVGSVVRLDTQGSLKFTIRYTLFNQTPLPEEMKNDIIAMLQKSLASLAKNTSSIDPLVIDVPMYKGMIINRMVRAAYAIDLVVQYGGKDHTDRFELPLANVPWASADNVEFIPNGQNDDINLVPDN